MFPMFGCISASYLCDLIVSCLTGVRTAESQLVFGSTDLKLCELIDLTNGHSRHTTL